ncbi:hypothetical protein OK006_8340 [Actinobacteria bacterium OK006]|nr:hypothetical protein OK006_8340 [Actinobacteria bacterium OK006]
MARACCSPVPTTTRRSCAAEAGLRTVIEFDPVEQYVRLMLGRTLERQNRGAEAAPQLRMAAALAGDFG